MQKRKFELKIQISHILKSYSLKTISLNLVKILVLLIKHQLIFIEIIKLRQNPLTLSLEENLMHRGSSLMIFFTSFQVDVKVIFEKTRE